jgi:hypothetical protein
MFEYEYTLSIAHYTPLFVVIYQACHFYVDSDQTLTSVSGEKNVIIINTTCVRLESDIKILPFASRMNI